MWICFVSLAVQVPALFIVVTRWLRQGYAPFYVALNALFLVGVLALMVVMYVCMYRRQRWARVLYVALVLLAFALAYKLAPGRLAGGWYWAGSYLFGTAAEVVNLALLLSPASNAWFRDQRRG